MFPLYLELVDRRVSYLNLAFWVTFTLTWIALGTGSDASGQDKQLDQAMKIKPKHIAEIEIENPAPAVLKECKFVRTQKPSGFIVHHSTGRILRQFIDTNSDGKLDQWSYFNNGMEVYRDVDSNFDGKLDQYRWMGTAGTRWGLDPNQDGNIDLWKTISAEEVAYECFQAIKNKDAARFNRLLLTEEELDDLGLNKRIGNEVKKRWSAAKSGFASMARSQKAISRNTRWVYSGNGQPAMMPDGDGNQRSLIVYDHGSGFFQGKGDSPQQLALGSLVQIGETWKMIELPQVVDPGKPLGNGGAFFPMREYGMNVVSSGIDEELAELYEQLAQIEKDLSKVEGSKAAKLERSKADVIVEFFNKTKDPKTKLDWLQNLADTVSSAFQADRFDGGIKYLNEFINRNKDAEGLDYVKWRTVFAEYGWATVNGDSKQQEEARDKLISELESFQRDYPRSPFSADALIQLGINAEVSSNGDQDEAVQWYQLCAKRFPGSDFGRRAQGALIRLDGQGNPLTFKSTTANGKSFDLRSNRGKMTVLHYWETWCCPEADIETLAKIQEKYKEDLTIVGCNIESLQVGAGDLESKREAATEKFRDFVRANRGKMTWVQLHEPGGVDASPLAHKLGVSLEPLVVLIDAEGKLVEANIAVSDLEREIERTRRKK